MDDRIYFWVATSVGLFLLFQVSRFCLSRSQANSVALSQVDRSL